MTEKNSIRDVHTQQPREKVFNIMRYRRSDQETFRANSVTLCCTPTPPNIVPTTYKLPKSYSL